MSKPKTHYSVFTITHKPNTGKWVNICKHPSDNNVNHQDDMPLVTCQNCQRMIETVFPEGLKND